MRGRWTRRHEGIVRVAGDLPRILPVPDRLPDGSDSVAAEARNYDVSIQVVRRWINLGLVPARRRAHRQHRDCTWLQIDEATDARLRRSRPAPRAPTRAAEPHETAATRGGRWLHRLMLAGDRMAASCV